MLICSYALCMCELCANMKCVRCTVYATEIDRKRASTKRTVECANCEQKDGQKLTQHRTQWTKRSLNVRHGSTHKREFDAFGISLAAFLVWSVRNDSFWIFLSFCAFESMTVRHSIVLTNHIRFVYRNSLSASRFCSGAAKLTHLPKRFIALKPKCTTFTDMPIRVCALSSFAAHFIRATIAHNVFRSHIWRIHSLHVASSAAAVAAARSQTQWSEYVRTRIHRWTAPCTDMRHRPSSPLNQNNKQQRFSTVLTVAWHSSCEKCVVDFHFCVLLLFSVRFKSYILSPLTNYLCFLPVIILAPANFN